MLNISSLRPLVLLALVAGTFAAIGPVTDLVITDAVISPDGFARDAIVVNGVSPGPLIRGNKVRPVERG